MNKPYQTHSSDQPGMTDSSHKLNRLKVPKDLTGKRVLDIGCNEGYFCNMALERGAESVTGVDADPRFLADAAARYVDPRLTFVNTSWHALPEGQFDLILWTSAMHYELDPLKVLRGIAERLAPGGLFILECGTVVSSEKEMVYSMRNDGGHWFPTNALLEEMFRRAGLKFRTVSNAEHVGVDPVPRTVFHCSKARPSVMLIVGRSGDGKTNLARDIFQSASKVVSLDMFVSRIAASKFSGTQLEEFIKSTIDRNDLKKLYEAIDANSLTDTYVKQIAKGVAASDQVVAIEGYMTDKQVEALSAELSKRANVWVVRKAG